MITALGLLSKKHSLLWVLFFFALYQRIGFDVRIIFKQHIARMSLRIRVLFRFLLEFYLFYIIYMVQYHKLKKCEVNTN